MANKFRNISRVNNIYDTNKNINKKDQEDIMSLGNFCGKVLGVCLVYAIIVFQVSMAQGSGTLKGTVIDKANKDGIVGANVIIQNTSLGTAADLDGIFQIKLIPPGKWKVKVSCVGYVPMTREVTIGEGETVEEEFQMTAQVIMGEEVVITAQAKGQVQAINLQLTSDKIVNVVSEARIQELPDFNAAQAISRLPGVATLQSSGEANKVVIRGLDPKYNQITIGGISLASTGSTQMGVSSQGGVGANAYTWMRYALTFQDSVRLRYALTDTADWVHSKADSLGVKGHYVYSFHPRSGTGTMSNGAGGSGTVWTVKNGNWNSTWSNGGKGPLASVRQAPRNAVVTAGTYNFAISVLSIDDTTNEVSWYLIKTDNSYWYGGTFRDTSTTKQFNGICFGYNKDLEATQVKLIAVKVDKGSSVTVPEAPWQSYYTGDWGIFGSRYGGWNFQADTLVIGNAGIGGTTPNTDWASIRGAIEDFIPQTTKGLKVTGNIVLVGGGIQEANSLRIGLLNGSAGSLIKDATIANGDSTRWAGVDTNHTGILIIPRSGGAATPLWGNSVSGSVGVIAGGTWLVPTGNAGNKALGNYSQQPMSAIAGAGTYAFALSVVPQRNGVADVSFKLEKTGYRYAAKITDDNPAVVSLMSKFNGIAFALGSGNTTTALTVTDLKIDTTTSPIDVGTLTSAPLAEQSIPQVYSLEQNYPNPFNPSTTIQYSLPLASHVKLSIYDVLGRVIMNLVDDVQSASYYKVQWNASNLSSGIYFYRLDARSQDGSKDFTSVKKLMLLK